MREKPYFVGERNRDDPGPVHMIWIKHYFKKLGFSEFTEKEIERIQEYLDKKKKYDFAAFIKVRNFLKKRGVYNEFE
ncbi:MAG: hypothetical protein EF811_04995 [Methanonatronarchaeia archaeon]|nr:MAG: hypothetical protein EF811_04995 [Methanonatronarchaeia archaeon]